MPNNHSKMFEKIKGWYDTGAWSKEWVRNAVVKGKITADEYEEIVGEPYGRFVPDETGEDE